jgi:hypothetical protein
VGAASSRDHLISRLESRSHGEEMQVWLLIKLKYTILSEVYQILGKAAKAWFLKSHFS